MIETSKEDVREIVVPLRPNGTTVAAVSLLAVMGATFLLPLPLILPPLTIFSAPVYIKLTALFCLALMVPALACIFYRCHARLVLSETGLRWRTWGEWRRASWDGVQDYFDVPQSEGSSAGDKLMTVRTDSGDVLLSRKWQESEAARRRVEARATHAAVTEWGVQGERSHAADTRTFRYGQKDFWFTLLFGCGVLLPSTGFWWYEILRPRKISFFAGAWNPGEFWYNLIASILGGILLLGGFAFFNLPALIFLALLPEMLDARKRRTERITTRQSGITFEDGKRQISADWDEVTGNFFQPSAYFQSPFFRATALSSSPLRMWRWVHVVETRHGSFEYSSGIADNKQLGEIIAARALPLEVRQAPPVPVEGAGGRV